MAAQLQRIQPATSLDTESSPEYVAVSSAPVLRNLLTHKPGRLIQRGGLGGSIAYTTTGAVPVVGPWWLDSKMMFTAADGSGTKAVQFATVNADGSITDDGSAAFLAVPRLPAYARVKDNVYGPGELVADGTDRIIKWDGTTGGISHTADATYPHAGDDYASYAERLFVLNGSVPGTTTPVLTNRLYWSDAGGPTTIDSLNFWEDDVSGLVNQLVLPDKGIALAPLANALAVFCKNSTHVLTGSGNSNFARKQILHRGATNRDAVCAYGDGAYFLSRDGLYYFDGAQERKVSGLVESKTTQIEGVEMTGYLRDAGNGYLYLAVYDDGALRWEGLHYTPAATWTEISFGGLTSGVQQISACDGHVVLIDKARIYNASGVASPGAGLPRGYDAAGGNTAIDTAWTTKTVRLGTPFSKAHVRRVIIDYAWMSEDAGNAWDYALYTAPTDQGGSAPTVLASGTITDAGGGEINRRRAVIEPRAEAENLWLTLSCAGTPTASAVAELYDVWVEYDPGQQSSGY